MTNEELKKKIVEIVNDGIIPGEENFGVTTSKMIENIADALIAAGIGDVTEWKEKAKKHRVQVLPDGTIKQLYSDEEVEDIALQRDEHKHRAEVAEKDLERHKRALYCACKASATVVTKELVKARVDCFLRKAERELAEERKDDRERNNTKNI